MRLRHFDTGVGLTSVTRFGETMVSAGWLIWPGLDTTDPGCCPAATCIGEAHVRADPCTDPLRQFVMNYQADIVV